MLVRPRRDAGESAVGYKLRIAHVNGLSDPDWMGRDPIGRHERLLMCPACLTGDGARWQARWQSGLPVCDHHETWLVDTCQACDRPLNADRARFLACRCGQSLADNEARLLSPAAREVIRQHHADASVLRWFGAIAKHGLQGKPGKRAAAKSMAEQRELLEAGAEVVVNWPAGFDALLDALRQDAEPGRISLLSEALPGLTKQILRIKDLAWRQRILDAANAYIQASQAGDRALLSRHCSSVASLQSVSKRLSISVTRASSMLMHDAIPVRVTASGRRRLVIGAQTEVAMRQQLASALSLSAAAKLANLSIERLRELIASRLIAPGASGVMRCEVDRLLARLAEASATESPGEQDLRALAHVLRVLVPRSATAPFFHALLEREVTLTAGNSCSSPPSCSQLFVSVAQVKRWLHANRQVLDSEKALDITRAARVLGVKPEVVTHLAAVGLLVPERQRVRSRGRLMFASQTIHAFVGGHVPLKELAASAGVAPKHAPNWARKTGIEMVCGPTIDGARQYIARRPVASPVSSKGTHHD